MGPATLSVILCNYNDSKDVGQALDKICNQSLLPDEVIVVDDGSTDNSVEVISDYAARFPIIRLLCNEKNQGILYSVSRAMACVNGQYLYFASANDTIAQGLFEKSLSLLKRYPQSGICCADVEIVDIKTGLSEERRWKWLDEPGYIAGKELALMAGDQFVWPSTAIVKRELLLACGGQRPEMKWHADWFAYHLSIAFRTGTCYIPEPLARIYVEPTGSYSASMYVPEKEEPVFRAVLSALCEKQNRDLIPLVVSGRALNNLFLPVMNMPAILSVLSNYGNWHPVVFRLICHLAGQTACKSSTYKLFCWMSCRVQRAAGLACNLADQAYARAMHQYDRLRRWCYKGSRP